MGSATLGKSRATIAGPKPPAFRLAGRVLRLNNKPSPRRPKGAGGARGASRSDGRIGEQVDRGYAGVDASRSERMQRLCASNALRPAVINLGLLLAAREPTRSLGRTPSPAGDSGVSGATTQPGFKKNSSRMPDHRPHARASRGVRKL